MTDAKDLLSTAQAADLLGISGAWLRKLKAEGRAVPVAEIGGTAVYSREEVERLKPLIKRGGGGKKRITT